MFMFFRIIACRRLRILTLSASVFYFLVYYKKPPSVLVNAANIYMYLKLIRRTTKKG